MTATTYIIFFVFIHPFIHDVYCAHVHLLIALSRWHKLVISFRPPAAATVVEATSTSKLSIVV